MNPILKRLNTFFRKIGDWKRKNPLFNKIVYTILVILLFRFCTTIRLPGVKLNFSDNNSSDKPYFLEMLNLVGGGGLSNLSIVALGISPYITSSIVMQLLQTEAFPYIYRLSRSGPNGKRKLNVITRFVTCIFSYIQAVTIIQSLRSSNKLSKFLEFIDPFEDWYFLWIIYPVVLTATSLFVLFLAEQITKNGVGNGTSLIIFSGVASTLVSKFKTIFDVLTENGKYKVGYFDFFYYLLFIIFLFFIITFFYLAQRRLPVQQTGSGLTKEKDKLPFLPIQLNPAGIMPIIFSTTIITLPSTIIQFFDHQNSIRIWIEENLKLTDTIGLTIFILISFFFAIIMSLVTFNAYEVSDRFKKNGTFILGIRPGEETENYLTNIIIRLAIFSGFYLSILSSLQYFQEFLNMNKSIVFSGTSLIILVTVSIETIDQVLVRRTSQNITTAKQKAIQIQDKYSENNLEGLIW